MNDELLTPKQRKIAYLFTAIGNGTLTPIVALGAALPLWAVCLIGGWNAAVAALALSNTPSTPKPLPPPPPNRDAGESALLTIFLVLAIIVIVGVLLGWVRL